MITNSKRQFVRSAVLEMRQALKGSAVTQLIRRRVGNVRVLDAITPNGQKFTVGYSFNG